MSVGAFDRSALVAMEMSIGLALSFRFAAVTPHNFLCHFLRAAAANEKQTCLCWLVIALRASAWVLLLLVFVVVCLNLRVRVLVFTP